MPRRRQDIQDPTSVESKTNGMGAAIRRFLGRGPSPDERLERAIAGLRRELDEHVARFEDAMGTVEHREGLIRDSRASVERLLRRGTEELDEREAELVQLTRELEERESQVSESESEVAKRRRDLGAVELKRAALEQRERALTAREASTGAGDTALAERDAAPRPELAREENPGEPGVLLFVPGASYRLVAIENESVVAGAALELDGVEYVVLRIGSSPLPADRRRCAYLVRGAPRPSGSEGSS